MPRDSKGNFHLNIQRAHAAERRADRTPVAQSAPTQDEGMAQTTLHDHGDGTFHTESHDGERMEHPHIGHALMHLAAKHSEGKHMHIHQDGEALTSHHVDESGDVEGPHEHATPEELQQHVGDVMTEADPQDAGAEPDYMLSGLGQ